MSAPVDHTPSAASTADPGRRGPAFWARWGYGLPESGLARARWFYLAFASGGALSAVPAVLFQPGLNLGLKGAGLAGLAVFLLIRLSEFRRGRLWPAWTELPQAVPLAFAAVAAGPLASGLALFFTGSFFRAVYASTRRTVATTAGTIVVLGGCALWVGAPDWQRTFLSQALGIAAATLLTRMLVATLTRETVEAMRNERLITTVFDNIDASVMVGASADAPSLMNRAARNLHSELGLPDPPTPWHTAVTVYGPDGRTPLLPEEMPAALALRGERVTDMDVALGLPDGRCRYFSMNAAPVIEPDGSNRAVLTISEVTAQRQAEAELTQLATSDPLTGLANRTVLWQATEEALAGQQRGGPGGAVILLDLDGFKGINDSLGHDFGDQVLRVVADRLRASLRPSDLIARLGGDEFAVLLSDSGCAARTAQRICDVLAQPIDLTRSRVSVSASVGLVELQAGQSATTVLAAADLAMYAAKTAGAGRVRVFHADMRAALEERLHLESDLARALERGEFELHYQPLVNLVTGRVTGSEALVRWRHPTRGLIQPLRFIPIVESNGMVVPLGRWILRAACAAAAGWQPADPARLLTVAVNVSVRQLEDPSIVDDVAAALAGSGLPPRALILEITESALIEQAPGFSERLRALAALGVRIAIDDFGTGYSSLSRLSSFPVDILKIDWSFVHHIEDATGTALVRAILALADALELDVIAEGIESPGQARVLAEMGCRIAQGFYFASPAPASSCHPPTIRAVAATAPR